MKKNKFFYIFILLILVLGGLFLSKHFNNVSAAYCVGFLVATAFDIIK
jgi:hypothetical protein